MLELKVAAVQSFALLINNFREWAQTRKGERRERGQARPGQAREIKCRENGLNINLLNITTLKWQYFSQYHNWKLNKKRV